MNLLSICFHFRDIVIIYFISGSFDEVKGEESFILVSE